MTPAVQLALLMAGAYLLGTIPFGLLIARAKGVDIRRIGSGNAGATNVGRALGRKWGVLVLLLDAGKGAAATVVARLVMTQAGIVDLTRADLIWLGAGLACVLGNIAPFYLGFRGGKGVATTLGAILGIYPFLTVPGLIVLVVWAAVVKTTGYVSLGSVVAAAALPVAFAATAWAAGWPLAAHWPLAALTILLAGFIAFRHRENLARIRAGTENRVGRGGGG